MGHFSRIRIIHSKDILLNWLTALGIKDAELHVVTKEAGRDTAFTSTLQSLARGSSTGKRLGIRRCEHASLAVDIADRARESTIHADLNVTRRSARNTRKHAGLHELAVDVDIHVPLEDRHGEREPRLQRHVLDGAREDIPCGRTTRIGRSRFAGRRRRVARMDGDADIQGILIRRQRDLGSLDTLVRGIATTEDDLLLPLAIVPVADLAPELKALINHTGRNLGSRHRI